VKKFLMALLLGAFMAVSLSATIGCTETKTGETKKTTEETKKSS